MPLACSIAALLSMPSCCYFLLIIAYIAPTFGGSKDAVFVREYCTCVGKFSPSSRLVGIKGKKRPHTLPYLTALRQNPSIWGVVCRWLRHFVTNETMAWHEKVELRREISRFNKLRLVNFRMGSQLISATNFHWLTKSAR